MKQKAITLKSLYGAFILDYIMFNHPLNRITCVVTIRHLSWFSGVCQHFLWNSVLEAHMFCGCTDLQGKVTTVCVHFCHADDSVAHQRPSTEVVEKDAFFLMECCILYF